MQPGRPLDAMHPSALPVVSVIMPLKDMPFRYVRRALLSAVEQDYSGHVEIVVWNDGSAAASYCEDLDNLVGTLQLRGGHRTIGVHHSRRNEGISAARNRACRAASGDWYVWLDGDDELPTYAVSHLLAATVTRRGTRLVVGQCHAVRPDGEEVHRNDRFVERWRSTKGLPEDPLAGAVFAVHGALVARSVFRLVGGFDETMSHGELTDWFLRVMAELRSDAVAVTAAVTYRYHKRAGSHSAQRGVLERTRVEALRRYAEKVLSKAPREIRFGRRCGETGARLYDLLTTRGNPVVDQGTQVETEPWPSPRPGQPVHGGVPERDPGPALVADA